jgi:hypothetical protein
MAVPIISISAFLYILGGITIFLVLWIVRLEIKLHRFLKGKDAKTLEDSFMFIKHSAERQVTINQEIAKEIDKLDARIQTSLRGFDTVRFNAFKGTGSGGNQSFAIALLNESGDGIILSSLYGRERFSAFAKPVEKGSSTFELTEEEALALQKAKRRIG